jgi:hypothetical protein
VQTTVANFVRSAMGDERWAMLRPALVQHRQQRRHYFVYRQFVGSCSKQSQLGMFSAWVECKVRRS